MIRVSSNDLLERVIELAHLVDTENPIDFGMLEYEEYTVFCYIANSLIKLHYGENPEPLVTEHEVAMLASLTHMVVQNFVLNTQLTNMARAQY